MRPPNWHQAHAAKQSFGERVADKVAAFIGSWTFIILQAFLLTIWVVLNVLQATRALHFDEYPFILMNLFMSAEAAFSTPLIMMAQNRQSDRDREQAQHDYDTNLAAKGEIEELQRCLARMENEKLDKIMEWMGTLLRAETDRRDREAAVPAPGGSPT
jgi:uncharacterized membrane protein